MNETEKKEAWKMIMDMAREAGFIRFGSAGVVLLNMNEEETPEDVQDRVLPVKTKRKQCGYGNVLWSFSRRRKRRKMGRLEEGRNCVWTYSGYDPQHALYLKYSHHSIHEYRCRSKRMVRTNVRWVKQIELLRKKREGC